MNVKKIILIAACMVALAGFFFPAISLNVNFFGMGTSTTFSLATFFNPPDNPFGTMDLPGLRQDGLRDLIDLSGDNNPFADVGVRLVTAVAAYFGTFILLVVVLIFALAGKLKKPSIVLLGLSLALFAYAGYAISTIPALMQVAFENFLGFFARLLDLSNIISINLGVGFWITLAAIACTLIMRVIKHDN